MLWQPFRDKPKPLQRGTVRGEREPLVVAQDRLASSRIMNDMPTL